jgi:transcriptional regulator with XRE-family HTH domain
VKNVCSPSTARGVFAANLRRERLAKGWSQMTLADHAGLHFTYVSSVECSKRNVSIDAMDCLARALGVDLALLLKVAKEARQG